MEKSLEDVLPIYGIEHDCILSKKGDVTIAFKVELPEIFTLSDQEYEALHHCWIKAIKCLPKFTVICKQDWFLDKQFVPETIDRERSMLDASSDRHFFERPYLQHQCYLFLTKMADGRKQVNSLFSNLLRNRLVPELGLNKKMLLDFTDFSAQFARILESSGLISVKRLKAEDLYSDEHRTGLLEKYCFLNDGNTPVIRDMDFQHGLHVGDQHVQLYTLSDAADLPSLCGPRINYERYSTDRTKFSVGFPATLGQLLPCNHIYSQYIFIEDSAATIQQFESKRLRLQSLSAYSRENMIARDATNDFLNEAIGEQRLPVRAHFNLLVWSKDLDELKEIKNKVSAAIVQIDGQTKEETVGAPQIYWAGIPGNAADFPMNETFSTFAEQASCFINMETGYRTSLSPFGLRFGDRQTGLPIHADISDEPMGRAIQNRNKFILGPSGACRAILN